MFGVRGHCGSSAWTLDLRLAGCNLNSAIHRAMSLGDSLAHVWGDGSAVVPGAARGQKRALVDPNSASGGSRRGPGRPPMADILNADGPLRLVAFVAERFGRWSFLKRSSGDDVASKVVDTLTFEPELDPVLTEGRRVLVGFGVVRSWRFVHSKFQSWESRSLAEAALADRPRQKGARFLEHEVIESVISQGTSVGDKLQEHFSHIGSVGSDQLLEKAMTLPGNVLTGGGKVEDLRVALAEWVQKFGFKVKSGLPIWAVWWPFALALANGTRKFDVSVIWQRQGGLETVLHAPTLPSANAVAKFKQLVGIPQLPAGPSDSAPQELASTMVKRGSVSMYTAESMLKSLRFSRHLKKNADFKVAVIEGVECALHFVHERADLTELKSDTRMPTRWTLERGAVILDIATMLAQRSLRDTKGPSYRYYGFDASPQRSGVEVFATLERSVLKSTMRLGGDEGGALDLRRLHSAEVALDGIGPGSIVAVGQGAGSREPGLARAGRVSAALLGVQSGSPWCHLRHGY